MVNNIVEVKLQAGIADLDRILDLLRLEVDHYKVWMLKGQLGAGKTTLVNKLVNEMRSEDIPSSPTFSLINEYLVDENQTLYHIDLYRINDIEEAVNLGITEYLDSGCLCLIEWPEVIEELIDPPYLEINIMQDDSENRQYLITKYD